MGTQLRMRLLEKSPQFERPAMLTLTIDRHGTKTPDTAANVGGFASPEVAHRHVSDGKFIAQLMRRLGVVKWVWVLEFQMKGGEGWPHWHLLVDLADCPGGLLDLPRAWRFWRDRWGIGGLDLKRDRFADSAHAVCYLTKYLVKKPEGGYPRWVLDTDRRVRFVAGSRAIGPLVNDADNEVSEPVEDQGGELRVRPLIERMSECGLSSRVWIDGAVSVKTGQVRPGLLYLLPLPPDELVALAVSAGFDVREVVDQHKRTSRRIRGVDAPDLVQRLRSSMAEAKSARFVSVQERRARLVSQLTPYPSAGVVRELDERTVHE